MNLTIRSATANDYEACTMLLEQIDALHRDNLANLYRRNPESSVRRHEYWMGLLEDDRMSVLVAEEVGSLVGLIQVKLQETPPVPILVPKTFAFVDTLVVDHRYRRKGIARRLMHAAEKWAIERNAEYMELTVMDFNKSAIAFYEELQYEPLNRRMGKALARRTAS